MSKLLHVSGNCYDELSKKTSTKRIWEELAKQYDEYHIIGRAKDNHFHNYQEGKLFLHLVPKLGKHSFAITSFYMLFLIRKYDIEYMVVQSPIFNSCSVVCAHKLLGVSYMQEIHDTYYFSKLRSRKLTDRIFSFFVKNSLRNATTVRALNEMMAEMLYPYVPKEKVVVVNNRVDFSLFNKPKEDFELHNPVKLISVGTFIERKGYKDAIDAVRELNKKREVQLTLIGGGPQKEELIKYSKGINVLLIDRVPQEELVKLIEDSDIYLQTSYREGMPRTIIEAMAMRMPIITTGVSTIPCVIKTKQNGILIEPGDVGGLVASINQLCDDIDLRRRIAYSAFEDAKNKFEWNACFDAYRNALKTL